jgi:hypothetical protein
MEQCTFENLTVTQLLKKFPAFYGTRSSLLSINSSRDISCVSCLYAVDVSRIILVIIIRDLICQLCQIPDDDDDDDDDDDRDGSRNVGSIQTPNASDSPRRINRI